jgi:hypothetical protein
MNNAIKDFLVDSDDTGRHIVTSYRTGKKYYIEPIGTGRMADWGSENPATGQIENKKGAGKYAGSVLPSESVITEENGFKNIHTVESGSPYDVISEMDSKYPSIR